MRITIEDARMIMGCELWQKINSLEKRFAVLNESEKEKFYRLKEKYYHIYSEDFMKEKTITRQSKLYENSRV